MFKVKLDYVKLNNTSPHYCDELSNSIRKYVSDTGIDSLIDGLFNSSLKVKDKKFLSNEIRSLFCINGVQLNVDYLKNIIKADFNDFLNIINLMEANKSLFVSEIDTHIKGRSSLLKSFKTKKKVNILNLSSKIYLGIMKNLYNWDDSKFQNLKYVIINSFGQNVCPYCNIDYCYSSSEYKKYSSFRADLDHFLPKSVYPYFALSLSNLVPVCGVCNSSIKSDIDFLSLMKQNTSRKFVNPQVQGFNDSFNFSFLPPLLNKNILSCNVLKDHDIVNSHMDFFRIIERIEIICNLDIIYLINYFNGVKVTFPNLTFIEFYSIYFGVFGKDLSKVSLGKFYYDLALFLYNYSYKNHISLGSYFIRR